MPKCLYCEKPCEIKYCSVQCQQDCLTQLLLDEILQSKGTLSVPHRTAKRLLILRGHKCSICERAKWMGQPIPLVIDHIDGNAENTAFINYRLVCGNCDMQLPTYKSKNRGNGRAWRRLRYAEGKSY